MNWRLKLLLILVCLFLGNSLFAARFTFPNYGFFVDSDGVPLDGDYAVTFSLYSAATDGTALWTETQTVAFDNGLYNTTLGASDSNLLPDDLADNTALYLGIKISGDAEATPRVAYSSTPWAKLAEVADRATLADVATVAQSLNSSGATSLAGNGLSVSGSTIGLDTTSIQTWTGLQTYSSQLVSSKDPADTTSANASVLINPTTASANEKLFAAQDNGTDRFTIDKEGDVTIGGTLTVTGGIASLTGVGDVTSVTAGTGLTGGGASGDLSLALDQSINASWTGIHLFQTDVNFQFSGSENLAITSDLAGSVDMLSMVATPSATAGTTQGIVIQQANSANTNGLDVGLVIDNADADLALPKGIQIKGSSLGAVTTAIDASDAEIGTALDVGGNTISFSETDGGGDTITLQPPTTLGGNITLTLPTATGTLALTTSSITGTAASLTANGTNCSAGSYALGVDASGNAEGCTVATSGSVTSVATSTGLSGGTITSTGTLSLSYSDTLAGNPALTVGQAEFDSGDSQGGVLFEGSANAFEGLLTVVDPTADQTWTLPNATGTIALTSSSITGNASTATALAANGTNCGAGSYPLGVDASGNAEGCTVETTGTVTSVATSTGLTGGTITGSGTLAFKYSDTLAANPALTTGQAEFDSGDSQGGVLFEGLTADAFEGLLTMVDPTADQTWTLPNATGTIALTSSSITGNASTATALAANGTNCGAGSYPLGVDASGNVEGCTVETTGTVTSVATSTGLTGGTITGSGTLAFKYSDTLVGNPALTTGQAEFDSGDSQGGVLFEGLTADTFEGLLTVVDPTVDQTWTLPNATGTIALTSSSITGNAATATALAADPANCAAGQWAGGVTAAGVAEGCTADDDTAETDAKVANDITLASTSQSQSFTFGASNLFLIDATTTANTGTSGVIDLNVGAGNAAVEGIDIGLTQNNGATTGVDAVAQNILLTGNDADGDMFGIKITGALTATAAAGTYEAGITIDDAEDTAGSMPDAILITSSGINAGVTNAINASAANITNALNAGVNNILFAETDLGGDAITLSPPATVAGNITLTLPASAGTLALTSSNVSTATALAADPANCAAGQWAGGITAAGVAEGCTADDDTAETDAKVANDITLASTSQSQSFTFGATNLLTIDAITTANTGTSGVINLDVGAGDAAVVAIDNALTQNNGATAGRDAIAENITLTANDADGDMFGIKITGSGAGVAVSGSYEAGIVIDDADNTANSMPDAVLVTSSGAAGGVTDAIDASASNIVNALNAGVNNILFAETDGNGDTITLSPPATVSGNIALTLPASAGTVALTTSNVSTATALAADPANCAAGQWAAGVTAAGVAEGCTADDDTPDNDSEVPNDITIASTVTNAAGGSATPIGITSTLAAFDGSDDYTAVNISLSNADHAGVSNTVQGVNISGIVGDAQATETAIKVGSGWDYALDVNGSIRVRANSLTIADDGAGTRPAGTLTPTTSYAEITCSDTDGCDVTISETGANQGQELTIVNISTNTVNFADTSGVTELAGAFGAGQWDVITMRYVSDRWVEVSRSNN